MIWLRNNQEDKLEGFSALAYGNFMSKNMTFFDRYINTLISVENIQEKTDDIIFHMNQLMDLYIHCKLLEKWIEVTTEKNRIDLFKLFSDLDSIKSICSLSSVYSYSRLNAMGTTVNEYLQLDFDEFCEENQVYFQVLNNSLKGIHDNRRRYLAVKTFIDLYIMDCFWMYLRIFPNPDGANIVGQISTDIGILTIVDFIDVDIFEINPLFMKERKITLSQKLSKAAIKCLDNYRQLAQLLSNRLANHSSGTVINQILNDYSVINNFYHVNNSTVNHNETFNFEREKGEDTDINYTANDIFRNESFKTFCNISPNFKKIWECLSSKGYWVYDGKFIQRNKETFPEYCLNLLAHEEELLKVPFRAVHSYFKKLFNYTDINKISVPDKYSRPAWLDILNLITNFIKN